jgi:hypothetical protein
MKFWSCLPFNMAADLAALLQPSLVEIPHPRLLSTGADVMEMHPQSIPGLHASRFIFTPGIAA